MATSCSPTVSPSWTARTVTVCAVPQLPVLPWVKTRVFWSPDIVLSVSTATAELSPEETVIVTSAPGSVASTMVYSLLTLSESPNSVSVSEGTDTVTPSVCPWAIMAKKAGNNSARPPTSRPSEPRFQARTAGRKLRLISRVLPFLSLRPLQPGPGGGVGGVSAVWFRYCILGSHK